MDCITKHERSLRLVLLLVAVAMTAGWLVAMCETHEEECHECCTCALPCCQMAVLSGDSIFTTSLEVTGTMQVSDQTALLRAVAPLFRPPKA